MHRATSRRGHGAGGAVDFSTTRRDLYNARHLPGTIYYSEDICELEIEKIWMKDWLCVGRVEQFPNAGDYKAMRIGVSPSSSAKARAASSTPSQTFASLFGEEEKQATAE